MRILFSLLFFASLSVSAENNPHGLGVVLGSGTLFTDSASEENDVLSVLGLYYSYQFTPKLGVEVLAFSGGSSCAVTCSDNGATYATLNSYQLNSKALLPLSKRWSLFGKLGLNSYHIEYDPEHEFPYSYQELGLENKRVSGVGAVVAAGIEFKAQNGFHFGFQFQDLSMKEREYRGFNAYTGISF